MSRRTDTWSAAPDTPRAPDQVFGDRVRELRKMLRMTQKELARQVLIIEGDPQPDAKRIATRRQVVGFIEREGWRRTATVRELTIYAAALGVSPAALLAPDASSSRVAVGTYEISGSQARAWFRGSRKLFEGDPAWFESEQGEERRTAIKRYPRLRALLAHLDMLIETAGRTDSFDPVARLCNDVVNDAEALKVEAATGCARLDDVAPDATQVYAARFEQRLRDVFLDHEREVLARYGIEIGPVAVPDSDSEVAAERV